MEETGKNNEALNQATEFDFAERCVATHLCSTTGKTRTHDPERKKNSQYSSRSFERLSTQHEARDDQLMQKL